MDEDPHIGQLAGHVGKEAGAVVADDLQGALEALVDLVIPVGVDPTLRLFANRGILRYIGAIALMDTHAEAAGDITDDVVARQGIAAARELDQAIVQTLDGHAGADMLLALGAALFCDGFERLIGFLIFLGVDLLDARHDLPELDTAVTDGGVEVVDRITVMPLDDRLHALLEIFIGELHARLLALVLKHRLTLGDILLTTLFLEPLADLGTRGIGLDDLEPITLGTRTLFLGQDLDDVAALDLVVDRNDASVDLGADHAIADAGMDRVRHIDDRCTGRQIDDIALRRKDIDLVGGEVVFDSFDDILSVLGVVLHLDHLADPREVLRQIILLTAAQLELVFPVRRDTVFRGMVHLVGTDLHLKGDTVTAKHRGVKALVHIRLGGGDIVLEAVGQRGEDIVHQSEDIVAVADRVDDHAYRKDVEDLVDVTPLHIGLAINGHHRLDASLNGDMRDREADFFQYLTFDLFDKRVALILSQLQTRFDLVISDGVKIAHGEILELILDRLHTQTVRDRRIDLHALERLIAALLILDALDGAHIVQAVSELDDDHADIVAHRDQHLADVLRLTLLTVSELNLTDLGQTVDKIHDLLAERVADLCEGDVGILDGIVQQRRYDRIRIHAHLGKDTGDRGGVQNERYARDTALITVSEICELIRLLDFPFVIPDVAFVKQRQQFIKILIMDHFTHPSSPP